MKTIRELNQILRQNLKTLLLFESLYKLLAIIVFTPSITGLIQLLLHIRGYHYLSFENLKAFAIHPVTFAILILIMVLATIYSIFDISAVIYILDASYQHKHISLKETFLLSFPNLKRVFERGNSSIILMIFFMIPFFNLGVASSYLSTLTIPEFILSPIQNNRHLLILFGIFLLVLAYFLVRWLYAFHYFTLESCTFKEARQMSRHLNKRKKWIDFILLALLQVAYYILFLLIGLVLVWLIMLLSKLFASYSMVHSVTSSVVWFALIIQIVVFLVLTTPISYGCISILYYHHKTQEQEDIIHCKINSVKPPRRSSRRTRRVLLAIAIVICTLSACEMTSGDANPDVEYIKTMEVTAHRGASADYPENTMSAFRGANKLGADWIELDVQQTKDGQIIVMHDTNLNRITGIDRYIWNTNYEDITYLDAGIWFSDEFAGEPIPLLSDVITYARLNNVQLNIELKPTGHETDFEQQVVDIINEHHFQSHCVVTSQQYDVLRNIKKIDPDITTVYVMSFALGQITTLSYADAFSIEASNITTNMVNEIHNQGKQIYAWTVNTQPTMRRMIQLKVDNIITDDVTLAKQCIYDSKTSNMVRDYMDFVQTWLPNLGTPSQ